MIKSSVFANKKSTSSNAIGNSANSSSTSSSLFENSLQQHHPSVTNRNWQQTPTNSRRLIGQFHAQNGALLYPTNSTNNIRPPLNVQNQNNQNPANTRVKPTTLPGLVENLNELLGQLSISHTLRYENKYGFEDILTVLDHLTNPNRYETHRFHPFPPAPQSNKPGGKVSLTDRWAYLKHVLISYRLSTVDQLARIKPDRSMSNEHTMILVELLIQLSNCLLKSEQEHGRIFRNNFVREFKLIMRQMFWVGRYDPSVMEEAMHELKHHVYAKENLEPVDRIKHEKQINQMNIERDQLKQQFETIKKISLELENETNNLTNSNENEIKEVNRKQEEFAEDQAKLLELTQIVEQKELDKKHLTDRNQSLSDRLFSQQTDGELQRHIRTNTELKQQHEVLLSTLLLEQQLHSTAINEQKRLVKQLQDALGKYQILLSAFKHKSSRSVPSVVDFDLTDIIGETGSSIDNDAVKQAQIAIEQMAKEMNNQEISLTDRHRTLEQESKKRIEELQSAEREWKSAAKHGQRRAAQQNELSRFQQEIRTIRTKIVEIDRRIDEKTSSTAELKKDLERIKSGTVDLINRFEQLEQSYTQKDEELRQELNFFLVDQTQLAKSFRRDVEELKRIQQEHLSKLEIHRIKSSFDELIQQQIEKFYHKKPVELDEDEEEEIIEEEHQRIRSHFEKFHDEHVHLTKKKKKSNKTKNFALERFQELYDHLSILKEN